MKAEQGDGDNIKILVFAVAGDNLTETSRRLKIAKETRKASALKNGMGQKMPLYTSKRTRVNSMSICFNRGFYAQG